ncbi:DUF5816 domain-containing protein [Haladaptatus sp. CMSO5]|uniref:DUF5816 domain-containing protein n=1 Tax=Haladaptatus sp. CMSO5 TaxID=3120514 RepID=UPI002FCDF6C8
MDAIATDSGETLYVTEAEAERGSKGPFLVVYETDDGDDRWGFYCSHCNSLNTAMDSMGRIKCNDCGNIHKADEWDAAHE